MDLSAPLSSSMNDGISRELCSFRYVTVDTVAAVPQWPRSTTCQNGYKTGIQAYSSGT